MNAVDKREIISELHRRSLIHSIQLVIESCDVETLNDWLAPVGAAALVLCHLLQPFQLILNHCIESTSHSGPKSQSLSMTEEKTMIQS